MAKPTITTRAGKGSALTWTEGDANLTNLRDATISVTDGTNTATLDLNDTLTLTAGTGTTISVDSATKTATISSTASGGDVVSDTTPQLGGDLDVNGHSITSNTNGNIKLDPDGTGVVDVHAYTLEFTDTYATIGAYAADALSLETSWSSLSISDSNGTTITPKTDKDLTLATDGAGEVSLYNGKIKTTMPGTMIDVHTTGAAGTTALSWTSDGAPIQTTTGYASSVQIGEGFISVDVNDGTNSASSCFNPTDFALYHGKLNTGGSSALTLEAGVGDSSIVVGLGANADISVTPSGTGKIVLDGLNWPTADGTSNQVLKTDGSGNLSWATVSGGGASVLDDLTDVVITSAATGDLLYYNGSNWVDYSASSLSVGSASTATTADSATTATTATNANNVNIITTDGNASDTTMYLTLVPNNATGNQALHLDSASLYYNASSNTLYTGTFNGNLAGGSITGTTIGATSAITANSTTANNAKLTIGTGALSSTAWTTAGVGLKVQSATYTDTSSAAGTVSASHVHAIAAPTMASTNAITINDAATLYIAGVPTNGTNTTITNKYALLVGGKIRTTGDMSVDGSLNANTGGSFGTLTTNGTVDFQATGSLSQEVRFRDNDNSNYVGFKAPGTISANKIWVLPSADGSANQVLKTDGSGNLGWATASGTVTSVSGAGTVNGLTLTGTVTSSGSLTLGGTLDLSSPPAIGGTSAAAGTFTNLSSTGTLTFKNPIETLYDLGTTGGTITPDCANGSVQKITLNSALTINGFANATPGESLTLIIYGGTAYTSITSTMKFAGGVKTLTGTAGCIDILSVYYDGTNYFASLGKGFA